MAGISCVRRGWRVNDRAEAQKKPGSARFFCPVVEPRALAGADYRYLAAINATVMSSMRLEKPHSLSYQLSTLTMVPPITRVCVAS